MTEQPSRLWAEQHPPKKSITSTRKWVNKSGMHVTSAQKNKVPATLKVSLAILEVAERKASKMKPAKLHFFKRTKNHGRGHFH